MKRVSVDILTGFLGSGKTTLLSGLLSEERPGEKIAVVMNEIGDIGIDGRVITDLDYVENVVELTSGCICCTIDDYRFDLAIQELVESMDPTLVVIETTGLADPEPTAYRVKQAGLGLDAVITVVDAANIGRALAETTVARRQIAAADFLVVSKADLCDSAELGRLDRRLRRMNRRALRLRAEHGRVDDDLLFATSVRGWRAAEASGEGADGGDHLRRDRIGSFSYSTGAALDQRSFERFLDRLPGDVLRAKGLVRIEGNDWTCLFNFTCGRYELNWVKLGERREPTQAVFIGKEIERVRERIESDLDRCRTVE